MSAPHTTERLEQGQVTPGGFHRGSKTPWLDLRKWAGFRRQEGREESPSRRWAAA